MPLILALIVLALVAGVVALIGSTGWFVRSGIEDLARRHRLLRGTDPLQLTAEQALDVAHRSYVGALEALSTTIDSWYSLQETFGIGTTLEVDYSQVKSRADADPAFNRLLEKANSACLDNAATHPASVADLVAETARMDSMTLEIRSFLYRARLPKRRGPGGGLFR